MRHPTPTLLLLLASCARLDAYAPYGGGSQDGADGADTDAASTDNAGWDDTDERPADTGTHDSAGDDGGGGAVQLTLSFWQDLDFWYDYLDKGHHEVLIGPEGSTDPKDGQWVVAVDAASMQAAASDATWAEGRFDLGAAVRATGWSKFRLAFHYRATNGDTWYLDDICVSSSANPLVQSDCDLGFEGFEVTNYPRLPSGWSTLRGATHQGSYSWETWITGHSGSQCASVHFSINTIDQYLVSPAIPVTR